MSYLFDANDDYLLIENPILTAAPLTLSCWIKVNTVNIFTFMDIVDKDVDAAYFSINTLADGTVQASARQTGGPISAATTTQITSGTWHHVAGVFGSGTDRRAFLNGGSKGTSVTSVVPTNLDRLAIGRLMRLTPGTAVDGRVAEAAIWDRALEDYEIASLATGRTPLHIPGRLQGYWPMLNDPNDDKNGFDLTVSGATTSVDHPTIYGMGGGSVLTPTFDPTGVLG